MQTNGGIRYGKISTINLKNVILITILLVSIVENHGRLFLTMPKLLNSIIPNHPQQVERRSFIPLVPEHSLPCLEFFQDHINQKWTPAASCLLNTESSYHSRTYRRSHLVSLHSRLILIFSASQILPCPLLQFSTQSAISVATTRRLLPKTQSSASNGQRHSSKRTVSSVFRSPVFVARLSTQSPPFCSTSH